MPGNPSVAVVILSWNGRKFLERFLPPLLKTTYPNATFYVADNASTDDSVQYVSENFPSVKIIRIEKNYGFAEGYNVALRQVEAEYYVLLNQDVEVTPGWIEPVIGMMENDKKIAACQPKLLEYHHKEMFEYAGAAGGFIDRHGYAFCRGRFFGTMERDRGQYQSPSEIVWGSGACLFVRSKLYHALGGLDGDFFAHFEEIDLCMRFKNAGYSVMYCPDSTIYHVGGGSLPKGNPKKTFLNYRNNLSAIVKNFPAPQVYQVIAMRYLLDMISAWKSLLSGNRGDFPAIAKAHVYFITNISKIISKRKQTLKLLEQHKISAPNRKGYYKGSIIADYFIRKIRVFSELPQDKFE